MPVFDIEGDGLCPTKIHVLSYWDGTKPVSLTDYDDIRRWLSCQKVLIGHNIIGFDIPVLERLLGIKIKARLVDTLYLSYYLYPERRLHGLESWGEDFGVPKPIVKDWENLPLEVYINRCEEDVKINQRLWDMARKYLARLYEVPEDEVVDKEFLPIVGYLSFKADCLREQEERGWKLDKAWCQAALDKLSTLQQPLIDKLASVMPEVKKTAMKSAPAKPFKKDGTLSVEGVKWRALLKERGLPDNHKQPIEVVVKIEPPNPNSPDQIKNWLYMIGWVPETFKFTKEDDGTERQIPQVKIPNSPDLCPSVLRLVEDCPEVAALDGLSVLKHRLGVLKGFMDNVRENGSLKARMHGLTNTLRLKHTEIVNLPGVAKPWGEEIRGCLVAREGKVLIGTDMVSLEDTTKRHYMYFHDPEYVEEMSKPGFDPHLDLALRSGAISKEDLNLYVQNKDEPDLGDNLKKVVKWVSGLRKSYKVVNYSSVYGVGAAKLARELKCSVKEAKKLLEGYWERNWSVKKIAEECVVKTVGKQQWLYNPVSKFWYSLRNEKDRFSTLNQSTGVYCFDTWVRECRKLGVPLNAQFHDESVSEVDEADAEEFVKLQLKAMDTTNEKLNLNIKLGCTPQVGLRYSEIH